MRITILLALALVIPLKAQEHPAVSVVIERLMSAEEFRNAGLEKLTAPELAAFNAWLEKYSSRIAQAVSGSGRSGNTWLALDSSTLRVLSSDGDHLYVEALTRDGNESFGTYDLTKQPDGTFVGRATLKWSCRFWCHDISCSTEQWVENSCTTETEVVLTHIGERRIEGYITAPKAPQPLEKPYA